MPSVITMNTELAWADPGLPPAAGATPVSTVFPASGAVGAVTPPASTGVDLPGFEEQAKTLRELLDVGLNNPALLQKLGTTPSLGVLLSGPAGAGKTTLVRTVAKALNLTVRIVWCPQLASMTPDNASAQIGALRTAGLDDKGRREVIVLDDVEAIVPADSAGPVEPTLVTAARDLVAAGRAVVALSAVAADLVSLVNAAAQQAACREQAAPTGDPKVSRADFAAALATVHPSSMDGQLLDPGQRSAWPTSVDSPTSSRC